jgi:hypothetical protein
LAVVARVAAAASVAVNFMVTGGGLITLCGEEKVRWKEEGRLVMR